MRRRSMLHGRLIVLLAMAVAAGADASSSSSAVATGTGGSETTAVAPVAGAFVGTVEGTTIGVALIADQPSAEGQPRTVSMYVCNGTSLAGWLTGQLAGNSGFLQSADHQLQAKIVELKPLTATGVLGLSGGRQLRFTAKRAVGVAGLYDVTIANSVVRGTSSTGVTLTGRLSTTDSLAATTKVAVTATAGGQPVTLVAPARRLRPGTYRWIVLSDRTLVGANTLGPAAGSIGTRANPRPTGGKVVRISAGSAGQKGYDDKKCQGLANKWNKLVGIWSKNLHTGGAGGRAVAAKAAAAADNVYREMDDHCVVVTAA
jgi:hypothetical protein